MSDKFFTGFVCFRDVYLLTAHPRTGCDVEQYNKWDVNQPRTFVETDGTAALMVYFLIRERERERERERLRERGVGTNPTNKFITKVETDLERTQ